MRNPVVAESIDLYAGTRAYGAIHVAYLSAIALFVVIAWPARSTMYFFRGGFVPVVFQATMLFQTVAIAIMSTVFGLNRPLAGRTVRLGEWIEQTDVTVAALVVGKLAGAAGHTALLGALGLPFALIAAIPAGVSFATAIGCAGLVILIGFSLRVAAMTIGYVGESRYVVFVTGPWILLGALFVGTIHIYPPLNPVMAVGSFSAGVDPSRAGALFFEAVASWLGLALAAVGLLAHLLARHRRAHRRAAPKGDRA